MHSKRLWYHAIKVYLSLNTHLLEVGEGGITDQKCIVKDKAFGWILRVNTGVNQCQTYN